MKKIEQKLIKFIDDKKLIEKDDRILVALSGGSDSILLLHFLNKFKRRFGIQISAMHINHKMRGKESDEDEKFCSEICNELNIKYFSSSKNVRLLASRKKISIEEAGREARYLELNNTTKANNYNKIATAHNSSDNAETVLLNLIKGTGLSGIAGIPVKRGNIIRPILNLTKQEILNYLDTNKIEFRFDRTNLLNDFERNFLRNKIIPALKENLNPSLENSLFNSSEIFKNLLSYVNKKNAEKINKINFDKNHLRIQIRELEKIDSVFLGELIKAAVNRNFSVQLQFNDISRIKFLIGAEAGKTANLSGNLFAFRERDEIVVTKNMDEDPFEKITVKIGKRVKINGKSILIIKKEKKDILFSLNNNNEYISAEKLENEFIVRKWHKGDKFVPLGMKGTKKISDFLTEQKIPSAQKKNQLVLTNGGKIVWVIGLRINDKFKLSENTKKIYQLCLI